MKQTRTFPGRYESLIDICRFVVDAAKKAGLSDSQSYAVELAVDEACTNIIEHAYGGEGIGDIRCTCDTSNKELTITLYDFGRPFNPRNVPPPNSKARLKDLKPGGAGLFLIYKMMDEVHFNFTKDDGNVLTMVKLGEKTNLTEGQRTSLKEK